MRTIIKIVIFCLLFYFNNISGQNFNLGISIGADLTSANNYTKLYHESNFDVRKEDINLNSFDIALNAGINYDLNKKLGFSINYSHGLIPFFTEYYLDPGFSLIIGSNAYHQYFQFAAKYFFL